MAYYVRYNGITLTDKIKVREVNTTLTPPRENSTINIFERAGEIYNGYRWDTREITLSFLLLYTEEEYDDNPLIVEQGMRDIRTCFNVSTPRHLYLGDPNKFINAVPDGDIEVNELRYNCVEITVKFLCYDPFFYDKQCKMFTGTNRVKVDNEGDVPTDPIIEIGIDEDCHFVQLENTANNKKMLIGNFPVVSKPSLAEKSDVLIDECSTVSGWTVGTASIDSDRTTGGTLAITSTGQGVMCGNFGSAGSTTWHGVSARKNLGTNIENFEVHGYIFMNSIGTNGDPHATVDLSDPEVKYSTVNNYSSYEVTEGGRSEQYKVVCQSLHIRSDATKSANVVGYLKNGDIINPTEWSGYKGLWGKIGDGQWCYCSPDYVQKIIVDNTVVKTVQTVNSTTVTRYVKNYYAVSGADLRWGPAKASKIICTIPAGDIVRVVEERIWETAEVDGNTITSDDAYWYKLESPWNGNWGYVDGTKVAPAENVTIQYPEDPVTADDKTGIIELYGYDTNGTQLFKLSMRDENKYYTFNYPSCNIGGTKFIEDNSIAPEPKSQTTNSTSNDGLVVKKDYLLSGQYGDWNSFFGEMGVKRENGYWHVWFVKMQDGYITKQMWSNYQKINDSPSSNLAYLTIYMGTNGDKPCDMSFERIEVKNLTPVDPTQHNPKKFQKGDIIKVDCYNNRVWLNDKLYNNIEIGSQFFPLEVGENTIKITSDKDTHSSVVFNEKYL